MNENCMNFMEDGTLSPCSCGILWLQHFSCLGDLYFQENYGVSLSWLQKLHIGAYFYFVPVFCKLNRSLSNLHIFFHSLDKLSGSNHLLSCKQVIISVLLLSRMQAQKDIRFVGQVLLITGAETCISWDHCMLQETELLDKLRRFYTFY